MPSNAELGLCGNPPPMVVPISFCTRREPEEKLHKRQREYQARYKARSRLYENSTQINETIHERLWATMYLIYLVRRLDVNDQVFIRFTDLPELENLSIRDNDTCTSSPATGFHEEPYELQEKILNRRQEDALFGIDPLWGTLTMMSEHLTSGITGDPSDGEIAFRVFDDDSHARFFESRGDIRCGNWRDFQITNDLKSWDAKDHTHGIQKPTNYISISTSPRRLWNYIVPLPPKNSRRVAIIDLRVLRSLGIAYGSTTDDLGLRVHYATKHHILVLGWVPKRSILGFLSITQLKHLLQETQIDTSKAASQLFQPIRTLVVGVNTQTDQLPLSEYEKKFPSH